MHQELIACTLAIGESLCRLDEAWATIRTLVTSAKDAFAASQLRAQLAAAESGQVGTLPPAAAAQQAQELQRLQQYRDLLTDMQSAHATMCAAAARNAVASSFGAALLPQLHTAAAPVSPGHPLPSTSAADREAGVGSAGRHQPSNAGASSALSGHALLTATGSGFSAGERAEPAHPVTVTAVAGGVAAARQGSHAVSGPANLSVEGTPMDEEDEEEKETEDAEDAADADGGAASSSTSRSPDPSLSASPASQSADAPSGSFPLASGADAEGPLQSGTVADAAAAVA
jgi:hypothetical protein